MSEGPLPLAPMEVPSETFREPDEESPLESGNNFVAPEQVLVREPSPTSDLNAPTPRDAFAASPRLPSTLINIDELPEDLAATLRPLDINGDGKISLTELVHGAMPITRSVRRYVDPSVL